MEETAEPKENDRSEFAKQLAQELIEKSGLPPEELSRQLRLEMKRTYPGVFFEVPSGVKSIFADLFRGASIQTLCDPSAYAGELVAAVSESAKPARTVAITGDVGELGEGKEKFPDLEWHVGDSFQILEELDCEFDVIVNVPPFGSAARKETREFVSLLDGSTVRVRDSRGNNLLVASALRLAPNGIGYYVVPESFLDAHRSVLGQFAALGLYVSAIFTLPGMALMPFTHLSAYLVAIQKEKPDRRFLATLTDSREDNERIFENFRLRRDDPHAAAFGLMEASFGFARVDLIEADERIRIAQERFGFPGIRLGDLSTEISMGRHGDDFAFPARQNSIYVPLHGRWAVVDSPEEAEGKLFHYAQIVIDPQRSQARFVASFLNSTLGRELRERHTTGGTLPRLSRKGLENVEIFVPDLVTQKELLRVEALILREDNIISAIRSELTEAGAAMWSRPAELAQIEKRIREISSKLSGPIQERASLSLEQWFETLPFPLASILRAWQATPTLDYKAKYDHLLHFFEATAQFLSVILLSAFSSDTTSFDRHRTKLTELLKKHGMSYTRATFGTWKATVEYLSKQARDLLANSEGEKQCARIFGDLALPAVLSRSDVSQLLARTNKMRNDWGGHTGVVGAEDARYRNEQLLSEVQKLREIFADVWQQYHLVNSIGCRPKRGGFETDVALLMGSNSEFLKQTVTLKTCLDVESLYIVQSETGSVLPLLPLVHIGPSPKSAKNACYFFSRMERDGGVRFVSYHFTDQAEVTGAFENTTEAIRQLVQ